MQRSFISRIVKCNHLIAALLIAAATCLPLSASYAADTMPTAQAEQAITKVSLNSASAEELSKALTGIGEKKAQAIVAFREQYGPFKNIDEIVEVKGIGAATFQKNKDKLAL